MMSLLEKPTIIFSAYLPQEAQEAEPQEEHAEEEALLTCPSSVLVFALVLESLE